MRHHISVDAIARVNAYPHASPVSGTPVVISGNDDWIAVLVEPADHAHVATVLAALHNGNGSHLREPHAPAIAGERTRCIGAGFGVTGALEHEIHKARAPNVVPTGRVGADP